VTIRPHAVPNHPGLEGCCNFRDVGGHRTIDGGRIRPRRLFRSDSLAEASPTDCELLERVGLRTVIDLRDTGEAAFAGRYPGRVDTYHHLPLGNPMHDAPIRWSDPMEVARRYYDLMVDGGDAIAEVFAVLTDPSTYPVVVHCSVGKDRTGIVIALVLSALGVTDDDVAGDYAASGLGAARLVARLRARLGDEAHLLEPALPVLLSAEPQSMRHFLGLVRDEHGSAHGYVESLGLASATGFVNAALVERAEVADPPVARVA
jgi:protein-tyrosine phosphatase